MKQKILFSADFIPSKQCQKHFLNIIFRLRKADYIKGIIKEPAGYIADNYGVVSKLLFSRLGFPHLKDQIMLIQWKTKDTDSFCLTYPNRMLIQVQINNCIVGIGY